MTRTVKIVGHQASDGGWGTYSPQVRGVYGHGESFREAVADWRAAAELYRQEAGHLDFVDGEDVIPDAVDTAVVMPERATASTLRSS